MKELNGFKIGDRVRIKQDPESRDIIKAGNSAVIQRDMALTQVFVITKLGVEPMIMRLRGEYCPEPVAMMAGTNWFCLSVLEHAEPQTISGSHVGRDATENKQQKDQNHMVFKVLIVAEPTASAAREENALEEIIIPSVEIAARDQVSAVALVAAHNAEKVLKAAKSTHLRIVVNNVG